MGKHGENMTVIYCPLKKCQYNNAKTPEDEGICTKENLEMEMRCWYDCRFVYCPEYEE